uniref:ARAD1D31394p n=1 Tax=Blastobotrys adeninivorans TaxID=409370 RepID=A0A060TGK9_BLAAD
MIDKGFDRHLSNGETPARPLLNATENELPIANDAIGAQDPHRWSPKRQFGLLQARFFCHRIVTCTPLSYVTFMLKGLQWHESLLVASLVLAWLTLGLAARGEILGKRLKMRYGQKFCLLLKFTGNILAILVLGFSTNIHWAFAGCFLIGLSSVGDELGALAKDILDWPRQKRYTLIIIGHIGLVTSILLGVFLADPVEKLPSLFGSSMLLKKFPNLLLNLCQLPLLVLTEGLALLTTQEEMEPAKETQTNNIPQYSYQGIPRKGQLLALMVCFVTKVIVVSSNVGYFYSRVKIAPLPVYGALIVNCLACLFAELFSFWFWEWLSGRYGRKVSLQLGNMCLAATTVALGFSDEIVHLIFGCFLTGFFGTSFEVMYGMGQKISGTHPALKRKVLEVVVLVTSFGIVVGSLIGMLMSDPVARYPSWIDSNEYPSLLASLAHLPFLICAMVAAMFTEDGNANPAGHEPSRSMVQEMPQKFQVFLLIISTTAHSVVFVLASVIVREDGTWWVMIAVSLGSLISSRVFSKRRRNQLSRRTRLLRSTIGVSIANILMGIARSTLEVLAGCLLLGMSTVDTAEIKKIAEELVSGNSAHMRKIFKLWVLAAIIFMFLGSLITPLFTDPVTQYPSLFGSSWLFGYFPNLLVSLCMVPFLVAAGVCSSKICESGTGTTLPLADPDSQLNVQLEELSK